MENTKNSRCKSLIIDETKYRTLFNEKFAKRKKWETPDEKKINSFIPGTIVKIYIKKGQKVKGGDAIVILETMKMLNKIKIPVDGTVKKIVVKTGQKITKGQLMVELE